tara:strand:- start:121 stop:750 length:630 start_codon:yes stop_codon:yes gene_type:complete
MSNLTNEEVEFYQDYQLATPGQSLTNPPDQKYPWEGPPQFTNRHDAELYILTQLTEEEVFLALMDMIGDGITVEAITTTYLYNGYAEGLWNADLLLMLVESVAFMIIGLVEKVGLDYKLYQGEEEDDALDEIDPALEDEDEPSEENALDKTNNMIKEQIRKGASETFTNKELEEKIEEVPEELVASAQSLLERDKAPAQEQSLLAPNEV